MIKAHEYQERFKTLLDQVQGEETLKKKQWNDLKHYANRYLELQWEKEVKKPALEIIHSTDEETPNASDLFFIACAQVHTANAREKDLAKLEKCNDEAITPMIDAAQSLVSQARQMNEQIQAQKAKIGATPKASSPSAANQPDTALCVDRHIGEQVEKVINELSEKIRPEVFEHFEMSMKKTEESYLKEIDPNKSAQMNRPERLYSNNAYLCDIVHNAFLIKSGINGGKGEITLREDADQRRQKKAEALTSEVLELFKSKQMSKIPAIIQAQGGIESIEANLISKDPIEARMNLKLDNGASFEARTQLVAAMNQYGTRYFRYPTTFHNVHDKNNNLVGRQVPEQTMHQPGFSETGPTP